MLRRTLLRTGKQNYSYPAKWHRMARKHKEENPLCVECLKRGRLVPMLNADGSSRGATDHIIPHRGNDKLRYDWNNLQSLCFACHNKKTKRGE